MALSPEEGEKKGEILALQLNWRPFLSKCVRWNCRHMLWMIFLERWEVILIGPAMSVHEAQMNAFMCFIHGGCKHDGFFLNCLYTIITKGHLPVSH